MLEIRSISKTYLGFRIQGISFGVDHGDYCVILGPSGAGKTVLLEILAGLIRPDEGTIVLDGKDITGIRIQDRPFGLVFQDHAVFPHMKVWQNIAYSIRRKKEFRGAHYEHAARLARICGIDHLLDRYPAKLSGGELQRVALARTLMAKPRFLLLDEPLASLDIPLRQDLRGLLRKLNKEGQTIIHVTHDFEEAMVLASKVVVIREGKVIQAGSPGDVFHHPASAFMVRFTGIKNYFESTLAQEGDKVFAMTDHGHRVRLITDQPAGKKGFIMIRGEDIIISGSPFPSSATNQYKGKVTEITPSIRGYEIRIDAGLEFFVNIVEESTGNLGLKPGNDVWISFKATGVKFIPLD